MNKFQAFVIVVFIILIVGGVLIFSAYKGSSQGTTNLVFWGTMPRDVFEEMVKASPLYQGKLIKINYFEKSPEVFDSEFIEALASGEGPDLFMLPSTKIITHQNKVFPIPYDVFTERQFKSSFVEGAEIYMTSDGVLAFPISINPLVMYWNRSIFNSAKLTQPPMYWDEFYGLAGILTKKDGALNINQSTVALGEFGNVANAKAIILNLAMQAGTPVTIWNGNVPQSVFTYSYNKPIMPSEAAVNFFTEFSNPSKSSYSWNRSLRNSIDYFLGGDLAIYFGFGSEIEIIRLKNPNLNFDVAPMPVSREGGVDVSYGEFNAIAISKASKNINAAFSAAVALSGKEASLVFSQGVKLPPSRRDLLATKKSTAHESVFYESAIRTKTWLDPAPSLSDSIFKVMVESITSGRARVLEAIGRADKELNNLFSK